MVPIAPGSRRSTYVQFPFSPQVAVTLAKEELLVPGYTPSVADTALDFEDRYVKAYAAMPKKTVARISVRMMSLVTLGGCEGRWSRRFYGIHPLAYLGYHFEKGTDSYLVLYRVVVAVE